MVIEQLMLPQGGVIVESNRINQQTDTATVCIGIGGTGIAALADLKDKIRRRLNPDVPGAFNPTYEGIQLLAIDRDETALMQYSGNCRLSEQEFFSLRSQWDGDRMDTEQWRRFVREDPCLNWLDTDSIPGQGSGDAFCHSRQMGRFLLFQHSIGLVTRIRQACVTALEARQTNTLNVHLFAGISGGIAGACFPDVCYLVRHVIREEGWNGKIAGHFFLPEVINSKPEVAAQPECVARNNALGYAALKELDYLMNLENAHDYFEQTYPGGITVRTQEPPVDLCFLLSEAQAEGNRPEKGFDRAIQTATVYVLTHLAECEDPENGSLRGQMTDIARGVHGLPRWHGANRCYHSLGVSVAKLPMREVSTYLAAGFFEKFDQKLKASGHTITEDFLRQFMADNSLQTKNVADDVIRGIPELVLPEMDPEMLALAPCCQRGTLPTELAKPIVDWQTQCRVQYRRNAERLTRVPEQYTCDYGASDTLIGRMFKGLCDLAKAPEYGPYCAASLLDRRSDPRCSLYGLLSSEIERLGRLAHNQRRRHSEVGDEVVRCNQELIDASVFHRKKAYANFRNSVGNVAQHMNLYYQFLQVGEALQALLNQLESLYEDFFKPMCCLLDSLHETFQHNANWLRSHGNLPTDTCEWNLVEPEELRPRLDRALDSLDVHWETGHFLGELLKNPDLWQADSPEKVTQFVSRYMAELFRTETHRTMAEYLYEKYPRTVNDPQALTEMIRSDIIPELNTRAVPLFQCVPGFNLDSNDHVCSDTQYRVPNSLPEVRSALERTWPPVPFYGAETAGDDRIGVLKVIGGLPLCSCLYLADYKRDYEALLHSPGGVGLHLYSATGRGEDGSGSKDWASSLPDPVV